MSRSRIILRRMYTAHEFKLVTTSATQISNINSITILTSSRSNKVIKMNSNLSWSSDVYVDVDVDVSVDGDDDDGDDDDYDDDDDDDDDDDLML